MLTLSTSLTSAFAEEANKPNATAAQKVLDDMEEEDEAIEAAREAKELEEEEEEEEKIKMMLCNTCKVTRPIQEIAVVYDNELAMCYECDEKEDLKKNTYVVPNAQVKEEEEVEVEELESEPSEDEVVKEESEYEEEKEEEEEEEEVASDGGLFSDSEQKTNHKSKRTVIKPIDPTIHPRITRGSRGSLITTDRELMFASLEKAVATAFAKDEASHSNVKKHRLLERDYAAIRVEVLKQYRNIPDAAERKKQDFIKKSTQEIIEELLAATRVKKAQPKITVPKKKKNNQKKRKASTPPPASSPVQTTSPAKKAKRIELMFD